MADLLQHPALVAWRHACEVTDHMDAVFDSVTQSDEWNMVHDAADSLRHHFGMAIPPEVWDAYVQQEGKS
ncbi:hypothetical protein N9T35_00665 [bacterium]|nr:hypothetical protein [bacterium]